MDNFYIRFNGFLEDEKGFNKSNVLDYKYETLYYDNDNVLKILNKHTSNVRELGTISSQILIMSKSEDEKYTVIITEKDTLLFDCYFDLINSSDIDIKNTFIGIKWGEDEFVVICRDRLLFFDVKMKLIGENTSYEFVSVDFRKKYNLYACATKEKIVFVESNGLEHGEHLNIITSHLTLINDDLLLCAKNSNNNKITVELYYSKNFHWYKKQSKKVEGSFFRVIRNNFYIKQCFKTLEYTILNAIDSYENRFYVVDDTNILYTDMNKNKTPPPMSNFVIDCKKSIMSMDVQENIISILITDKLLNFDKALNLIIIHECGKNDFPDKIDFTASYKDDIFTFHNDKISCYSKNKNRQIDLESLVYHLWNKKKVHRLNTDFTFEEYSICNLNTVDMKLFDQLPCLFLNNGNIIIEGIVLNIEYNFTYSRLDVKKIEDDVLLGFVKNKRLVLFKISTGDRVNSLFDQIKQYASCANIERNSNRNNKSYQEIEYHTVMIENHKIERFILNKVDSFILDYRSFVFIQNKYMNILVNDSHQFIYSDPEFRILGCTDLEIFGETRHGTLETFYPKSYSDIFVQKLIERRNYKKALEMSNNNYNMFMKHHLDIESLSNCPSKLLLSFILEVSKHFDDYKIILDSEEIEKYRNEFDDELYLNTFKIKKETKEKYIKLAHNILCTLISVKYDDKFDIKPVLLLECYENYSSKTAFLNILLKHLDPIKQFDIILFVFVKFKRTDLAIKISQIDLNRGIKYLMTLTTIEDIKRAVISSFDQELITEVYRIIQHDVSDISNYIANGGNIKYRLSNLIEDRPNSMYYLVRELSHNNDNTLLDSIKQYVKKYVLGRELLIYSCFKQFKNIQDLLLELYADTTTNDTKAIKVYKYLDRNDKLINLYIEKNMFREAVKECKYDKVELYPAIKKNLERSGLFYDLGVFYEEYEKNISLAIRNYLKSKKLSEVLRLIKLFDMQEKKFYKNSILTECVNIMRNQLTLLDEIFRRYKKYRDRLKIINNRADDYINDDTSFSFSILSEKTRGRPGGIYEKEFILEKLANLGTKIYKWREDVEDLIEIFQLYEDKVNLKDLISQFDVVRDVLRSEFYDLFKDDYVSYDNTKKHIVAPDLFKYI